MKLQLLLANVMNKFLGAGIVDDSDYADTTPDWVKNILNPIFEVMGWLLPLIMILVGVAGMIYLIVVGVKFAKAENADEKDQAKKKLINIAIALIVIIIALVVVLVFINNVNTIFGWVTTQGNGTTTP